MNIAPFTAACAELDTVITAKQAELVELEQARATFQRLIDRHTLNVVVDGKAMAEVLAVGITVGEVTSAAAASPPAPVKEASSPVGRAGRPKSSPLPARIFEKLVAHGGSMRPIELAEALSTTVPVLRKHLPAMEAEGLVVSAGRTTQRRITLAQPAGQVNPKTEPICPPVIDTATKASAQDVAIIDTLKHGPATFDQLEAVLARLPFDAQRSPEDRRQFCKLAIRRLMFKKVVHDVGAEYRLS